MPDHSAGDARNAANSERLAVVTALYAAERGMGFQAQTSMLNLWVAATTYLTAGVGIVALLTQSTTGQDIPPMPRTMTLYAVSFVACALAGHHLIFFGIGSVHSHSIRLLEAELIVSAPTSIKSAHNNSPSKIGSKAETDWTEGGGPVAQKLVSVVAFSIPYLSAFVISGICNYFIEQIGWIHPLVFWFVLVIYFCFAGLLALLFLQTANRLDRMRLRGTPTGLGVRNASR